MKQSPDVMLESHLGYLMRRVSNRVSEAFAKGLADRGVSISEWVCLVQIHNQPQIMPSSLAAEIGMTQGAISKICEKLLAKGWIIARENDSDLRGRFLSLTESGSHVVPELIAIAESNEARFFGGLPAEERDALRRILLHVSQIHNWNDVPLQ